MSSTYQLDASLGFLINQASRGIRRRLNAALLAAQIDLTGEQWAILVHLWEREARTQNEVGQILQKDKTTITRLVDELARKGWVERRPGTKDRRRRLLYLTPLAKNMESRVKALAQSILDEAQIGLSEADLATTRHVLRHLYQTLNDTP